MKALWAIIVALIIVALGVSLKISSTDVNDNVATPDNNVESPSGRYVLRVVEQYVDSVKSWRFIVSENIDGKVGRDIFASKDSFRIRDRVIIMWDKEDRVWVYSGDVGTFYWNEQGGEWKKNEKIDIKIPSEVKNNIS